MSHAGVWLMLAQLRLQRASEGFKFALSIRGLSDQSRVDRPILERISFVAREQMYVQVGNSVAVDLVVQLDRPVIF